MSLDASARQQFRELIYEAFASVGKALASGRRLVLIDLLCQGERNVEEIARETGLAFATVSQHLQILRRAGLIVARRDGARVFYRMAGEEAISLWRALRTFAEVELPAVDRVVATYLGDRDEFEAISADELRARLEEGTVVLLDVRPTREFEADHIPGARSIQIDELEARLDEIPEGSEVVAYCRGRYCVYADDAVRKLREHGFQARRLELAVYDWH